MESTTISISELNNHKGYSGVSTERQVLRIDRLRICSKSSARARNQTLSIRTIRFQPGKKVTGRVIPPNGNVQLKNPVVSVSPFDSFPANGWRGETVECQADGRFSVVVASDVRVSIQATADNFAGAGLEVQPEVRDLDIQLQVGKKLTGQLLDREGRPVAGVLVYSETEHVFDLSHLVQSKYKPQFSRSSKTDANGKFELKPQLGKVRVLLRQSIFDLESHEKTSDRVPPVVVPIDVDLGKFAGDASVNLKEAKTVRASGTVRWPDGSPVIGIQANLSVMIGRSSSGIFSTETDSSGNYTVLIPENVQSFIHVIGARDSSEQWLFAKASATSDKVTQQGIQSLGLAPLTEDITGLDWKLSKQEAPKPDVATTDIERIATYSVGDGSGHHQKRVSHRRCRRRSRKAKVNGQIRTETQSSYR